MCGVCVRVQTHMPQYKGKSGDNLKGQSLPSTLFETEGLFLLEAGPSLVHCITSKSVTLRNHFKKNFNLKQETLATGKTWASGSSGHDGLPREGAGLCTGPSLIPQTPFTDLLWG